jgi:hypothetical protein
MPGFVAEVALYNTVTQCGAGGAWSRRTDGQGVVAQLMRECRLVVDSDTGEEYFDCLGPGTGQARQVPPVPTFGTPLEQTAGCSGAYMGCIGSCMTLAAPLAVGCFALCSLGYKFCLEKK